MHDLSLLLARSHLLLPSSVPVDTELNCHPYITELFLYWFLIITPFAPSLLPEDISVCAVGVFEWDAAPGVR